MVRAAVGAASDPRTAAEPTARDRVRKVEATLEGLDALPEASRERALDAVQALLELYGAAFERVLGALEGANAPIRPRVLAEDELIGHLLMVHGLHPLGFEDPAEVPGAPGGPPLVQLERKPARRERAGARARAPEEVGAR